MQRATERSLGLTWSTPKTRPDELNMVRAEPPLLPAMGRLSAITLRCSQTCRQITDINLAATLTAVSTLTAPQDNSGLRCKMNVKRQSATCMMSVCA